MLSWRLPGVPSMQRATIYELVPRESLNYIMRLIRLLNGLGAVSVGVGAILSLVALFKGREARALRGVVYVETLSELKHLLSLVPIIIAVTGRVWAPKPAKCELSDAEGAIVELREDKKSERRTASIWLADSEPLRQVVRETEWALAEGTGPFAVHLPVVDGRRAGGDYMQMSGDVFLPAQEGLVEQVIGQLAGHKSLGVRRSERFLPIGSAVTAVGELRAVVDHPGAFKGAFRSNGKVYVLQAPQKGPFLLSRQRLPDMIAAAEGTSKWAGGLALWLVAAGSSMLLAAAAHKAWVRHKEKRARERVAAARLRRTTEARAAAAGAAINGAQARAAGGPEAAEEPRSLCVVCLERECEMVFPACGHLCTCEQCTAGEPPVARCPICRSGVKPIRVFIT